VRKFVFLALLIVAGPLQAQFAYVCGMPKEMACCEGHGMEMTVSPDCEMQPGGEPAQCMKLVQTDAATQTARSASTISDHGVDKAPPVLMAVLPPAFEPGATRFRSSLPTRSLELPGIAGTQTYLVTQRLRI